MQKRTLKGFTLVELIVVITILAILGTIAFLSLQGYSANARDSKRVSDINNIQKSLELFTLQTEKYPLPDNGETVTYSGEIVWTQGTIGDNATNQLSRNLKKKPLDPVSKEEYIYSTTENRGEYEVLAIYEGSLTNNRILNQTHAADTGYVKIDGTYNELYTETDTYTIPVPSLMTSEELPLILDATNITSQVVTGQSNRPSRENTTVQTGSLNIVFSVYAGKITETSTNQEKIDIITAVQNAYSGSTLATQETYSNLLANTSTGSQVSFANTVALDAPEPIPLVAAPEPTGWRVLDSNCDIDDITIGTQVWAGCNSTLGNGFEWGKQDNGSNGTVSSCYNYSGTNNATCTIGDTSMASNTKANTWFTGTNTNGDTEVANIWGKLYTWANSDSACGTGYHVPSDAEWETLETTLNGGNCRKSIDGWLCDGLGWKLHDTKTTSNNIIQALKIPLAGHRSTDGTTFNGRGNNTFLWSSTPNGGIAYYRGLSWNNSAVYRYSNSQSYGFSVRCIKD